VQIKKNKEYINVLALLQHEIFKPITFLFHNSDFFLANLYINSEKEILRIVGYKLALQKQNIEIVSCNSDFSSQNCKI